jgi:arginine decarboxylase
MSEWSVQQSRQLYNISHWSDGYFEINDDGHVVVRPDLQSPNNNINLYNLINDIHKSGLTPPVLVRFPDILHDRVNTLKNAFQLARQTHGYDGEYSPVYPIKVNQEHSVVSELLEAPGQSVGLEAGSKTELMAVLALAGQHDGLVVCNGYKDREYIRLALIGTRLGMRVFIVLEKLSELDLVLEEAGQLGITPLLGVRVRLSSVGYGKWQNTGGEKSKFGLSARQTLQVVNTLRQHQHLSSLQLLHFHLGSQIANIEDIETGMAECTQYFAQLCRQGVPLRYVDVGGGLSIDYEGTHSQRYFSMNYSVDEYADRIVAALKQACDDYQLPQAHIITESGRAMTAHHAMLIVNVIDIDELKVATGAAYEVLHAAVPEGEDTSTLTTLGEILDQCNTSADKLIDKYHKAAQLISRLQQRFTRGESSIEQKAAAEHLYYAICQQIQSRLNPTLPSHRELYDVLNEKLADKYFCNFSLFQSIPDSWAIDQIFPIMPLHRLTEAPQRRATIHDITCDSDGCVKQYVGTEGIESSVALHTFNKGEPYYLGIFLVGAYQEILGDMHNLFGDTNSINIRLSEEGYQLSRSQNGDSVDYVLRHIHFDPDKLLANYRMKLEQADISEAEYTDFYTQLKAGLTGYTYLED